MRRAWDEVVLNIKTQNKKEAGTFLTVVVNNNYLMI